MSRELDNQVAKEIFGLAPHKCGSRDVWGPPYYSTDLDSAFEVEAWLFERGWLFQCTHLGDGSWIAEVRLRITHGATLPEAICRAALKAARIEKEASNGTA